MTGNKDYIRTIFEKYLNRTISTNELDELFTYLEVSEESELKAMIDIVLADTDEELPVPSNSEQEMLNRLDLHVNNHVQSSMEQEKIFGARATFFTFPRIAAAVLIIACLSISYWKINSRDIGKIKDSAPLVYDAKPGSPHAQLILADGSHIDLKNNSEGITVDSTRVMYSNGQNIVVGVSSTRLNRIVVPRGGQYKVMLSDGTKVWLNAASSLRYPGAFTAQERTVELTGEGYFEVSKNPKKPFKVIIAGKQEVSVLGTQFNINAYPEEQDIRTTLSEGSVKVTALESNQSVRLTPGKESILRDGELTTARVDVETATGWTKDDFVFKGQDLQTTMRQLSRWYDVDVSYTNSAPVHLKIGGSVSRKNNLSSVLRAMESTNSVKFDFDGKTIVVK